jgi:homoserine dehydrogenase
MLKLGLLGAGTVGSGVVKVLSEKKQEFEGKIGSDLEIKAIAVKDKSKLRDQSFKGITITEDPRELVNDPEIDIIVELIGGAEPAKTLIIEAIKNGKHIVTANKEVIAKYGNEIFELAHEKKVLVYIEGSVAGGIPIIQTLKRDLIANKVKSLMGIINGTTNFILTEMTQKKRSFSEVLKEAQQLGFAEADPTSDIEGFDPVYKLSIIASLIFGHKINLDEIYREGITKIAIQDIEYASKLGYIIKLLAIAKQHDDGTYEARVHPTMLPADHPLASVNGSFNAIWLNGDCVGDFMLYGRGAGQLPTASAVVADILNLAMEMKLRNLLTISQDQDFLKISSMDKVMSQYYIRLLTTDRPGVMGIIGRDLGISGVSISSIWQSSTDGSTAEIVLITHPVHEEKMNKAINLLKNSEGIKEIGSLIRVEDETGA